MKTSNIILLSAFASIIIWIVAALFTAKAKMNEILKEHPEFIVKDSNEKNLKTVQLESFHTIVVNGGGHLQIEKSEGWSFDQRLDANNKIEMKNDTLFVTVSGSDCNLNINQLKNIVLNDSVWVELSDFETDSFTIFSRNESRLEINDVKVKYIGLKSFDHSKIEFNGMNEQNTKAEFNIKNFSQVYVENTGGMTLTIIKDPDAKFESDR
jgi:hypothetical protein